MEAFGIIICGDLLCTNECSPLKHCFCDPLPWNAAKSTYAQNWRWISLVSVARSCIVCSLARRLIRLDSIQPQQQPHKSTKAKDLRSVNTVYIVCCSVYFIEKCKILSTGISLDLNQRDARHSHKGR
jgi:hypothetical protein